MTNLSNVRSLLNKRCIFSKSSKEFTSVVRYGKDRNSGYPTLCESMLIMGVTSIILPITGQSEKNSPRVKIVIFQHFEFLPDLLWLGEINRSAIMAR